MPGMRRGAGRFTHLGRFEVRGAEPDQYGNRQTAWRPYITRRVQLEETPAGESLEGGILQSHTRARCMVRVDDEVLALPTDARLRAKGRIWSFLSIAIGDPRDTTGRRVAVIALDAGVADGGTTPHPIAGV